MARQIEILVHEEEDGRLLEYRRHPNTPGLLESRWVDRAGEPVEDWRPVGKRELTWLELCGSDIPALLAGGEPAPF